MEKYKLSSSKIFQFQQNPLLVIFSSYLCAFQQKIFKHFYFQFKFKTTSNPWNFFSLKIQVPSLIILISFKFFFTIYTHDTRYSCFFFFLFHFSLIYSYKFTLDKYSVFVCVSYEFFFYVVGWYNYFHLQDVRKMFFLLLFIIIIILTFVCFFSGQNDYHLLLFLFIFLLQNSSSWNLKYIYSLVIFYLFDFLF